MEVTSTGHAAEQYLPENLRMLRERKGMSQAALAKAMSDLGWPWHQQTAYRIENAKQGIGLGEITDLASILGVSTDRLTWSGPEANAAALVDRMTAILHRDADEAATAIARLHAARSSAERTLREARDSKYPRVREAAEELAAEFADATLKNVTDEGEARWQQEREG